MATDIFDSARLAEIPTGHSFLDKESRCKRLFEQALRFFGPFYHLHTPEDHPVIFQDPDVYVFAMTAIGMCAHDCPKIKIITFELMSNHVHFRAKLFRFFRSKLFATRLAIPIATNMWSILPIHRFLIPMGPDVVIIFPSTRKGRTFGSRI